MAIEPWGSNPPPSDFQPARSRPAGLGLGPVTAVFIALCAVVAILSHLGQKEDPLLPLFISLHDPHRGPLLPEVFHGQVWRLFTPIFIHFGIIHLVFNMMAFKDLGTVVEKRFGVPTFIALVLGIGALSNFGQYAAKGPIFGGMSGVIYGLLGYVWMKSKFDPGAGISINMQAVYMMIVWFFLCLFGVIPNVANYAHGVGLVAGMIWGCVAPKTQPKAPLIFSGR